MLVPLSTFTPEVSIPLWALVHLPVVVTLSTAVFTPNGWVHSILYVLFENAMGIVKLGAVIAGMLDLKGAKQQRAITGPSTWALPATIAAPKYRPARRHLNVLNRDVGVCPCCMFRCKC